jgi:hypothetical protein
MKKVIASIALVCYLSVSCGVVINFHYCMDRLASTDFFGSEVKRCGKCKMDLHKSKGCCREEVKIIKMNDDQKTGPSMSYGIASLDIPVHITSDFIAAPFFVVRETRHYQNHSPPILGDDDIYLQNRVFRI